MPSKPSEPAKSILVVKVSSVSNERFFHQLLHVIQNVDVEVTR